MSSQFLLLFAYFLQFEGSLSGGLPFLEEPPAVTHVACGDTLELPWKYNNSNGVVQVSWDLYNHTENFVIEQIAHKDNTAAFYLNTDSRFKPASDGRVTYLPNAGLKIVNVQHSDESVIQVQVDYETFAFGVSIGKTEIRTYVPLTTTESQYIKTVSYADDAEKTLFCQFKGQPLPSLTWLKDGIQLNDSIKYFISEYVMEGSGCDATVVNSNLTIKNIAASDSGNFSCVATVVLNSNITLNQTFEVVVDYAPGKGAATTMNIHPIHVSDGEHLMITCHADSVPPPTYEIQKDGVTLASGTETPFIYNISDTQYYHEGNVSCIAINSRGSDIITKLLNVTVTPEVVFVTSPLIVAEIGSEITIECIIRGDPLDVASIKWEKFSGPPSFFQENGYISYQNSTITYLQNNLLIPTNSSVKEGYGLYKCSASNHLGTDAAFVWLYFNVEVQLLDTNFQTNFELDENQISFFNCTVSGYPKPNIQWLSNGNPLTFDVNEISVKEDNSTGLWIVTSEINMTFTSARAGELKCSAENGLTTTVSNSTNIIMSYKPLITLTAVDIRNLVLNGTNKVFVPNVNESVILLCTIDSVPLPTTISWIKNEQDVTNVVIVNETMISGHVIQSWISVQEITEDDNGDIYHCDADNSLGTTRASIETHILNGDFINLPVDPLCVAAGENATFDWQYIYTQPLDSIQWFGYLEDGYTWNYTLGRIENEGNITVSMADPRYIHNQLTLSGLTITDVTPADEGWYGIKINFKRTTKILTKSVYLLVITNPHDTIMEVQYPGVVENGVVTYSLVCTSVGNPPPFITWHENFNNTYALVNGSRYQISEATVGLNGGLTTVRSTLIVTESDIQKKWNYSCKANSKLADEFVHEEVPNFYAPINTTLQSSSNPALGGQSVVITCEAVANLHPIYYQIYHEENLIYNNTNGSVVINPVIGDHGGNYLCVPINHVGMDANASLLLNVTFAPVLMSHNSPVYAARSTDVLLTCTFYGNPKPNVYWSKLLGGSENDITVNSQSVFQNSSLFVVESNATTNAVSIEDDGLYHCYANNTYGFAVQNITLQTHDVVVNITSHTLVQPLDNWTEQTTISRKCIARGYPKPITIEWFHNSDPITDFITTVTIDEGEDYIVVNSTLTITNVDADDRGILKCVASNSIAEDSVNTTVDVFYAPILIGTTDNTKVVNLGASLTLVCVAEANEIATINWYKEGVQVFDSDGTHTIVESQNNVLNQISSTLKVSSVDLTKEGKYTCEAENSLGKVNASTDVNIYYPTKIIAFVPEMINASEFELNFDMRCLATGNPQPTITWLYENTPISLANGAYTIVEDKNDTAVESVLTINVVQVSDYGKWTCKSTNTIAGNLQAEDKKSTLLTIAYDPTFVTDYPSSNYYVHKNDSITLSCRVKSFPKSSVWWEFPSGVVDNGQFETITTVLEDTSQYGIVEHNLTITGATLSDYGIYKCFGNSTIKTVLKNSTLYIYYKASPDRNEIKSLTEGMVLHLSVETASNPVSNVTFLFNGTSITYPDHELVKYVNLTTPIETIQSSFIMDGAVNKKNSGVYQIRTCNIAGCMISQWTVIVNYTPTHQPITDKIVLQKETVNFTCIVDGQPPPTIEWLKDGTVLIDGGDVNIVTISVPFMYHSEVRSVLTVSNVQRFEDGAVYTCRAKNAVDTVDEYANLIIRYPPLEVQKLLDIIVNESEPFKLVYETKAYPEVNYTWTHNGSLVDNNYSLDSTVTTQTTFDIYQSAELSLSGNLVTRQQAGIYNITATNEYGSVTNEACVIVKYKPVITTTLPSQSIVIKNTSPTLTCEAESHPPSVIEWYRNGVKLSSNADITITDASLLTTKFDTKIQSVLSFPNIQPEKSDYYTCEARNSLGTDDQRTYLAVHYPPILLSTNQTITHNEGEAISLPCSNDANPPATYRWEKDGNVIDGVAGSYEAPATLSEAGNYLCTPINAFGEGKSIWYQVVVRVPPTVTSTAQCIRETLSSGEIVSVCSCDGTGFPTPEIYWTRLGSDVIVSNTSTYRILGETQNDGVYECHVKNAAGKTSSTAPVALFGDLVGQWTMYSGCNNTCGTGQRFRTRVCNIPPCVEDLIEWENCVGDCEAKPIPIMQGDDDDWYIALYVLLPLVLVGIVLSALWLARLNREYDDDPVIIPVNSDLAHPPGMPQHIYPNHAYINNGFTPTEMESIEVNLMFDDDLMESETDMLDIPDDNPTPPFSPSLPGTPSINSEFDTFYEELPISMDRF